MSKSRTRSDASRRAIARRVSRGDFGLRRQAGVRSGDFRLRDVHEVDPECEPTQDLPVADDYNYEPRIKRSGLTR